MKTKSLPPQAFLQECFDYNPDTGSLTWRVRPREHFVSLSTQKTVNTQRAGKEVGATTDAGYKYVRISQYGTYLVSRVIWKLVTGDDPPADVDHRDTNPSNNSWQNLRLATRSQNICNRHVRKDNTLGLKGVVTDKRRRPRYLARIQVDGTQHNLGWFSSPEEAHAAYSDAAAQLHGEFANSGV